MVNKVENYVEKPIKNVFKTFEKLGKLNKKILSIVYKTSVHQLFLNLSTNFYTTNSPLSLTNLFHYSTYPTIITTKK